MTDYTWSVPTYEQAGGLIRRPRMQALLRNLTDEELLHQVQDTDHPVVRELAERLDRANQYIEENDDDWE